LIQLLGLAGRQHYVIPVFYRARDNQLNRKTSFDLKSNLLRNVLMLTRMALPPWSERRRPARTACASIRRSHPFALQGCVENDGRLFFC
jgi:hypothetical protein